MRKNLLIYVCCLIIIASALSIIINLFNVCIIKLYTENMRNTLFVAFLTMGTFTLSLMSMFVFSFKDKLFDNNDYKKLYKAKQIVHFENISIYEPLVNITRLLIFCIACCFVTSLMQFTLGLFENIYAIAICLSASLCTILLALILLYNAWKSIDVWFKILLANKDDK